MDNRKAKEIREKIAYNVGLFDVPDVDVEDIIQEIAIKIIKEIKSGTDIQSENDYIFITTKNYISNFTRDQAKQLDKDYQYYKHKKLLDKEKLEHPYYNEIRQDFEDEIDDLPKQQRKVMKLTYQGYSNKEVAAELGTSLTNVTTSLSTARKKLQNKLKA